MIGYRGRLCAVQGCSCLPLTATTQYCAAHFQELVGKPRLREWLKARRAKVRKRTHGGPPR